MKNAFLLRSPDRRSAVVLMRDTLAVVHAELDTPLTAEQFSSAQAVHALAPVPVDVELGPYDMERTRYTRCRMTLDSLPTAHAVPSQHPPQHPSQHLPQRLDYSARRRRQ